ncbi:MAG: DUF2017 domain-containing protein [Hamadaea sp.]|nr:DUF2017 domain-containing protein [Hamadaea sp.]
MSLFRRDGEDCVATLSIDEVRVLRRVASEVVGLLTEGFDHDDPVVVRLFPSVYPDDPQEASEFRRFTEGDLKTSKIDQAGAVLAALPGEDDLDPDGTEVRLDAEAAEAWLRAINDVRLAMGVRLEITDETDLDLELHEEFSRDISSARAFQLSVYAYLGYLQESLLDAIMR